LDGDGKPDLAVVNVAQTLVSTLPQYRQTAEVIAGRFLCGPNVDFATGANPISVALGDLDGDGKPDWRC